MNQCSSTLARISMQPHNTRDGTRAHNLLLRREAPYPLGHTSSWHYLATACYTQSCKGQDVTSHICRVPAVLSGQRCRVQEVTRSRGCSLEHRNQQPTCPVHDAKASCHDCLLWWHGAARWVAPATRAPDSAGQASERWRAAMLELVGRGGREPHQGKIRTTHTHRKTRTHRHTSTQSTHRAEGKYSRWDSSPQSPP